MDTHGTQINNYFIQTRSAIDVNNRKLHLFREPIQERYESEAILSENASISPLHFSALIIAIADMFPPLIIKS